MPEPYDLSATDAAEAIRSRALSPVDLVESLLTRVAALDEDLHAWVRVDADGARAQARRAEEEIARGVVLGPLHGIPAGFKDIYHVAGLATEAGSPIYAGFVPERDADTVARLRAAGAIVLGKTETTQFALGDPAPTHNPWNLAHTPGGSSSGSAAAVAARMVPVALGTQTAGSVLRPAAYCGIVGFKPSAGRLSLEGIIPLAWSLDHPGTMTRTVADARLLFSVLDQRGGVAPSAPPSRPPRLGLLRGRFVAPLAPGEQPLSSGHHVLEKAPAATIQHLDGVAAQLERAGASLREIMLPDDFDLAVDVQHVIMYSEAAAFHGANFAARPDAYRPVIRTAIEIGSLIPASVYLQAQRVRAELTEAAARLFDGVDCLLMPPATGPAPADLTSTGNPIFNAPWSLFGMPAITVPSGLSANGLPLGLQIIGRTGRDETVLDAAAWCEQTLGPLPAPPFARLTKA